MTPEPQKEYIITDCERKKLLKLWSIIQQHIDWQHGACHTLDETVQSAYNILEVIRSRPYNPHQERERVVACHWKQNEEYGHWETECKSIFEFIEGDIDDNTFKFCPYCGGRIAELRSRGSGEERPGSKE